MEVIYSMDKDKEARVRRNTTPNIAVHNDSYAAST
jgi:hypothetical protein